MKIIYTLRVTLTIAVLVFANSQAFAIVPVDSGGCYKLAQDAHDKRVDQCYDEDYGDFESCFADSEAIYDDAIIACNKMFPGPRIKLDIFNNPLSGVF